MSLDEVGRYQSCTLSESKLNNYILFLIVLANWLRLISSSFYACQFILLKPRSTPIFFVFPVFLIGFPRNCWPWKTGGKEQGFAHGVSLKDSLNGFAGAGSERRIWIGLLSKWCIKNYRQSTGERCNDMRVCVTSVGRCHEISRTSCGRTLSQNFRSIELLIRRSAGEQLVLRDGDLQIFELWRCPF